MFSFTQAKRQLKQHLLLTLMIIHTVLWPEKNQGKEN